MHNAGNAEYMQKLFDLMGKTAKIERTDGQVLEGVVRSVSLDGAELLQDGAVVAISFDEMKTLHVPEAEKKAEADFKANALENLILSGPAGKVQAILKNANFCKKVGLSAKEADEILERIQKGKLPWDMDPCSMAFRYRVLLREKGNPENIEALYRKAIENGSPSKAVAILELLRLYIKKEAYLEAAALYEQEAAFLGEEAYAHMTAYGTALAHTKGKAALEAFLAAHPDLQTYSTNKNYFQKLLQKLEEEAGMEAAEALPEANFTEEPVRVWRRADYMRRAAKSGQEDAYLAFYQFLYETGESDAPILAALMLHSSRIWTSAKAREDFRTLCRAHYPTDVETSLAGAFSEVLTGADPEAGIRFLKKWHPIMAGEQDTALKILNREGHDAESPEIVAAMVGACQMPEAWRRLRTFYQYKGIECEGNILYAIAYYSPNAQDLYLLQTFARENGQAVLGTSAAMLRMSRDVHNPVTVRNACQSLVSLGEADAPVPAATAESFFRTLSATADKNPAFAVEILHAGQQFALRRGETEAFIAACGSNLSRAPKSFAVFALEAYRICPEEEETMQMTKHLLETAPSFRGKVPTQALLENPESLSKKGAESHLARQLIRMLTGLNVRKMYEMITEAVADPAETGLSSAIEGGRLLLAHFPGEGLLFEAMYYLLAARGDMGDAAEMYTMLYQYLTNTKNEPNLFVHYAKRLYCGLVYLERKGIEIIDAPKDAAALLRFFERGNTDATLAEEFSAFRHRVLMLDGEPARFSALLFAGLTGTWKPFMDLSVEETDGTFLTTETDMFMHEVGRYNFLRSLAARILENEEWQHFIGLLTETERAQIEAVEATGYGEAEKRMALSLLRCKILDKTGSEFLAEKIFATTSPETFGALLPVVRTLMLDSVLIEGMRKVPAAFLEEAARTVMEQKETVPHQILNKTYRDFLRAFSNLLFSRGLYKEADPILGLLFTTDESAYRHSPENRYANLTHAICRQRQKFCKLVCRDPEEVEKFHTTTEYKKLINIFAVQFASDRQRDWAKIAPLMTVLQKRLCAGIYYVLVGKGEEFEAQALAIQAQNPAMAEALFYYAERKFRDARWRERCRQYLPPTRDDEETMYFMSPKEHGSVRRLPILEILELGENPADGAEAGGAAVKPATGGEKIRRAIRGEEFLEMALGKYVLSFATETEALMPCREALPLYMNEPTIENGVAVLRAKDFLDTADALLRAFYANFALYIYKEAENMDDHEACFAFVPDLLTCLSAVSAIPPHSAELFDDVIRSILMRFESFEDYRRYFLKHAGHISKLLQSADAEAIRDVELYFAVAKNILDMEENWDGETKLGIIREQNRLIAAHGAGVDEAFVSDLILKVGEVEDFLKDQPLLTIHIDQETLSAGSPLTGYIENSGHAAAEKAILKFTAASGETRTVQMRTLFGDYHAPFAFPLVKEAGESISGTLCVSYIWNEEERSLTKRVGEIPVLPRAAFPLNTMPGFAIPVSETEKYFIGRTEEIESFKNEFYTLKAGEDGEVVREVRDPKEVPVMVVNGPKRVGKSSLLHRVEKIVETLPSHWVYVHFDAQGVRSLHEAFVKGFYMSWKIDGVSIDEMEAYEKVRHLEPAEDAQISALELGRYYAACRDVFAPGKQILFLIDEIEAVIRHTTPENLFNMLQFAMKNLNDVISFLICGSDDLTNLMFEMENKTQFFQLAKNFPVGKMPRHEYDALLDAFSVRTGLVPDVQAREALWLLTRGQIYYTHLIFNKLVDLYRAEPVRCTRCDMRLYDVYFAFDALQSGSEMFSGLTGMFDHYQSGEKEVIACIAQHAPAPSAGLRLEAIQRRCTVPDVEKALSRLEARGFVRLQGGHYMMSSEMYRVAFGKYAAAALYFRE